MNQNSKASLCFVLLLLASFASQAREEVFPVPLVAWPEKSELSLDELRRDVELGDAEAMKNLGVRYHVRAWQ
ncbi:MAG: hypothetical protein PHP85_12520 [Gallionella sp.]|nr:hypothetical protein [Gallionella sp.]